MTSCKPKESVFNLFCNTLSALGETERVTIAHTKRLIERIYGDNDFLEALRKDPGQGKKMAREIGANVDPRDLASIWQRNDPLPLLTEELGDSPLAVKWAQWTTSICDANELMRTHGDCPDKQPRFHAWRQRQMKRCESELGKHASIFSYPLFAFELSDGCSMGCPFCGVSSSNFNGAFERTEHNTLLWRSVLEAMVDLFGNACQTSVCYWATDPTDNPHYREYIEDFLEITGELPQTTTAGPLRDVTATKALLDLYNRNHGITTRFSVLSSAALRRIHSTFTPEELITARLLLYNQPMYLKKARAGRHFTANPDSTVTADGSTIACMSGFLVNMVTGKIQLITPCAATEQWPSGYKIFSTGSFTTAEEFRQAIGKMINEDITAHLENEMLVRLRPDIACRTTENGICFSSKYRESSFSDHDFLPQMGDLITTGEMSAVQIKRRLLEAGADVLAVIATLESVFQHGLLEESAATRI